MSALEDELDRLARINSLPLQELEDAVFSMRARIWRELGKIATDAALIEALHFGIAADFARREGEDAREAVPSQWALADIDADRLALPRRGLRRAVGRLMSVGPR